MTGLVSELAPESVGLDERNSCVKQLLRAQLVFFLNPHDEMDQTIVTLVGPDGTTEEFSDRVRLLLKHDWERAARSGRRSRHALNLKTLGLASYMIPTVQMADRRPKLSFAYQSRAGA